MTINEYIRANAGILSSDEIAGALGISRRNAAARASRMGISLRVNGRLSTAMAIENARRHPPKIEPKKEPEPWKQHIPPEVARINQLWRVTSL